MVHPHKIGGWLPGGTKEKESKKPQELPRTRMSDLRMSDLGMASPPFFNWAGGGGSGSLVGHISQ